MVSLRILMFLGLVLTAYLGMVLSSGTSASDEGDAKARKAIDDYTARVIPEMAFDAPVYLEKGLLPEPLRLAPDGR